MKRVALLLCLSPLTFGQQIELPHNLSNGSTANADQVMENFNTLRSDANNKDDRLTSIESLIVSNLRNLGIGGGLIQTVQTNTFNGDENTALGFNALLGNVEGYRNTAIGSNALLSNETGHLNTAVGHKALESSTEGFSNTAIGARSLTSNSTGSHNTAVGSNSLSNNDSGYSNVAIGAAALQFNTSGYDNIGLGSFALDQNITGFNNVAIGGSAMQQNTSGYANVAIGRASLISHGSGERNVAIGEESMVRLASGNYNTSAGAQSAGFYSGSYNTMIGFRAGVTSPEMTIENATAIGANAKVNASNQIQLGDVNVTSVTTAGKLTTGTVTYPNTHGASGQVLGTTSSGELAWFYLEEIANFPVFPAAASPSSLQQRIESLENQLKSQQEELLAIVQSQQKQIAQLQRMVEHQFAAR